MCRLSGDQSEQSTLDWWPLSMRRSFKLGKAMVSSRSATHDTAIHTKQTNFETKIYLKDLFILHYRPT